MSESYKLQEYRVGVMIMDVEGKNSDRFRHWVSQAADAFKNTIANTLGIGVELLAFEGPHLMPSAGTYAPLDFLQVGMNEKLERGIHFLLIVTNDIYGLKLYDQATLWTQNLVISHLTTPPFSLFYRRRFSDSPPNGSDNFLKDISSISFLGTPGT